MATVAPSSVTRPSAKSSRYTVEREPVLSAIENEPCRPTYARASAASTCMQTRGRRDMTARCVRASCMILALPTRWANADSSITHQAIGGLLRAKMACRPMRAAMRSAAMARAYVRISLRQQPGDFPDADAAESVIGELVANALQHAYHDKPSLEDTVLLALCDVPQGLMVLAADQSDDAPTPRPALTDDAESGRGLHLVAALAASWGWEPRADGGKVVYAVIDKKGADQ